MTKKKPAVGDVDGSSVLKWEGRRTSKTAAHGGNNSPSEQLEEVIRAREIEGRGEPIAQGDCARGGAGWTERANGKVRAEIGQLCELSRDC